MIKQIVSAIKSIDSGKRRHTAEKMEWKRLIEFCTKNFSSRKDKVLICSKWSIRYHKKIAKPAGSPGWDEVIKAVDNMSLVERIIRMDCTDEHFFLVDYEIFYFVREYYGGGPLFETTLTDKDSYNMSRLVVTAQKI